MVSGTITEVPKLGSQFSQAPGRKVVAVSDLRTEQLAQVQARYPGIKVTTACRPCGKAHVLVGKAASREPLRWPFVYGPTGPSGAWSIVID